MNRWLLYLQAWLPHLHTYGFSAGVKSANVISTITFDPAPCIMALHHCNPAPMGSRANLPWDGSW